MLDLDLQRAGLAAAIGLLVGIERGWQERTARDGSRVAGIRTYTLIGVLGGTCGFIARSPLAISLCFLAFALPFGLLEWRRIRDSESFSATNLVAGLLTFVLGAYAVAGNMKVAAASTVVITAVLAARRNLHLFLRKLTWAELRGALALLVMTVVLLPLLPDRTIDPWDTLNPHQIWLMTVLVGASCYAGYAGIRLAGPQKGLLFGGIMGGLATSTTVTWTFARLARRHPALQADVLTAILAAWVISLLRMTALGVAVAPELLAPLAPPIAASSLLLLAFAGLAYRFAGRAQPHPLELKDPFELGLMLRFCLLLAGIMVLAKLLSRQQEGFFALGGLFGALDVDPITLSAARLAGNGVSLTLAAKTILIAAASNGLAKAVLGHAFGGWRLGLMLWGAALAAFAVGAVAFQAVG
jgi:uncharacterized membrane protein (DUF4010 family)